MKSHNVPLFDTIETLLPDCKQNPDKKLENSYAIEELRCSHPFLNHASSMKNSCILNGLNQKHKTLD